MRALIAKEIREHLAAPVLAFVVLAVLVAANTIKPANAELFSPTSFRMGPVGSYLNYRDPTAPVPLVSGSFLGTYVVVACALAIVLGALMSWNEQLRHTWDFLIHRPVTRTRILLSKLLAGAVMYLLAVLVPLAWLSCWCAIPGNIPAPWTMSYVLRGLDTVTVGFLLFVASFLCGVRTARWYGTRFMPLLVCVCIVLVMATMQSIAAFYAAACLLLAVLLAALWSVFVRQTAGGRFATTCLICAGVVAATVFSAYIVLGYLTAPFVTDQPEPSVGWTTNGEPRVVYTYYQTGKCVMKTLDDEIVKETACTWSGSSGLVPMAALASWSPFPAAWFPGARAPSVQVVPGSYYRPLLVDYDGGYVVEYDQTTYRPAAYWGRAGMRRNARQIQAFEKIESVWSLNNTWYGPTVGTTNLGKTLLVADETGLFVIDLDHGSARKCSEPVNWHGVLPDITGSEMLICTRISNVVSVLDWNGELVGRFAIPAQAESEWRTLSVCMLEEDRFGIVEQNYAGAQSSEEGYLRYTMWVVDSTGETTWRDEYVVTYSGPSEAVAMAVLSFVMTFCPWLTGAVFAFANLDLYVRDVSFPGESHAEGNMLLEMLPWLLGMAAVCITCMVLTMILGRRRGMRTVPRLGWSLFSLLGGIPALVAVKLVVFPEKLVLCPKCDRRRPPSEELCPRCGSPWPSPVPREVDLLPP